MKDSQDSQNACSSVLRAIGRGRGRGGQGLGTLLTVLFVGLKLTDHIDWSWWWVLSPIWIKFLLITPVHPDDDHRHEAHGLGTQRGDVRPRLVFHREWNIISELVV